MGDSSKYWSGRAAALRRKTNAAWFLQMLTAPMVVAAVAGAVLILLGRNYLPEVYADYRWILGGVIVLAPVTWAWLVARRQFETITDSFVRLESSLGLNNALSAARAGAATWPPPPAEYPRSLRWRWPHLLLPPLLSVALLTSAILVPVTASRQGPPPTAVPTLWQDLQADADRLEESKRFNRDYSDELQRKIDALKAQKPEDWYSHASQEAAAQLAREHRREVGDLKQATRRARQAAAGLERRDLKPGQREKLAEQMKQALDNLNQGKLQPNEDLMKKLQNLDPDALKEGLTPEQLEELKQQMKELGEELEKLPGGGDLPGEEGDEEADGEKKPGPGRGKPKRGPGDGGDPLGKEKAPTPLGDTSRLESDQLRPSLGDKLQEREGEHEVERTPHQLREGGGTDNTGRGGDRILRNRLTDPKERALLKDYFSSDQQP